MTAPHHMLRHVVRSRQHGTPDIRQRHTSAPCRAIHAFLEFASSGYAASGYERARVITCNPFPT
eukprot:46779-Chlamydomonas_euryale.AAC.1